MASTDVATGVPGGPAQKAPPILRIANLSKTFPGTRALDQVDLEMLEGQIHALIGDDTGALLWLGPPVEWNARGRLP